MASFLIHMNMEHGSNQFLYQTVIGLYILGVWQPQHTTLSNLPHQAHGETSTPTLMAAMIQSDLWERAQMDSVVHYLMANRHLQLPEYFKGILLQGINPWNIFWFEILIREHHCDFESQRWPVVQRSNKGSYDLAMGKMVHNDSWHSVKNVGFLVCLHYGIVFHFWCCIPKNGPARMRKKTNYIRKKTNNIRKNAQECAKFFLLENGQISWVTRPLRRFMPNRRSVLFINCCIINIRCYLLPPLLLPSGHRDDWDVIGCMGKPCL